MPSEQCGHKWAQLGGSSGRTGLLSEMSYRLLGVGLKMGFLKGFLTASLLAGFLRAGAREMWAVGGGAY